ncbi:hypothetical protein N7488_001832 [Penicillium malachiteum]|nr:hypothetical protein N7488_001832 [Penicillium malachiteum]
MENMNRSIRAATKAQVAELFKAIEDLASILKLNLALGFTDTEPKDDPLQVFLQWLEFLNMNSRFNDIDLTAYGTHELQSICLGLFRPLLYQVLTEVEDALTDLVATLRQQQHTVGKDREEKQLKAFFKSSLRKALEACSAWLFIDVLNECGKDDAAELAIWFNSLFNSLPRNELQQFRICFTSRH